MPTTLIRSDHPVKVRGRQLRRVGHVGGGAEHGGGGEGQAQAQGAAQTPHRHERRARQDRDGHSVLCQRLVPISAGWVDSDSQDSRIDYFHQFSGIVFLFKKIKKNIIISLESNTFK